MDFEVEWAESALASLIEVAEYIAKDSPSYAGSLAVQAERAALSLRDFPNRGRLVREYRDPNVREIPVASYRLIYRVASKVSVIAFVHSARDLAALLNPSD